MNPSRAAITVKIESENHHWIRQDAKPLTIGRAGKKRERVHEEMHVDDVSGRLVGIGPGICGIAEILNQHSVNVMEHVGPDFTDIYSGMLTVREANIHSG
jgi:hypothetical protein